MEAQAENIEENSAVEDTSGVLGSEIRSLRSLIRRVETQSKEDQTLASLLNVLEMHSRACTRLATLLKAERTLGSGDELHEALMEALQRVRRELGIEVAGTFLIEPADRTSYCAAGEAILTVEVRK